MRNTNPALARAYELEQRGRLAEAIEGYRRLLASEPNNSDALHLLGLALARTQRPQEALAALDAAARLQPDNPYFHANRGQALGVLGRTAEARQAFERALALKADLAPALQGQARAQMQLGELAAAERALTEAARLMPASASVQSDLGAVLERLGRPDEALAHFERATILNPNLGEAHHNRGVIQAAQGHLKEALASLERALALQPHNPAIHANRGNVLADLGRTSEAMQSFDKALVLEPRNAGALRARGKLRLNTNTALALDDYAAALQIEPQDFSANFERGLGLVLLERHAEALACFERALALRPDSAEVLNNRGVALVRLDRGAEAVASFRAALASNPRSSQALINGANTLSTLEHTDEALQWFDRALQLQPHDPELAWGKGRLLLSLGKFEAGWPLYESRLQLTYLRPLQRHAELPQWHGESIAGKTLLVHAEQGLGDTLQFCRFVPGLEALGARVIFELQPALVKLMRTLALSGEIIASGETLPPFDLRVPLLSLPLRLGVRLEDIPATVPYLHADAARTEAWRQRLAQRPGLKVGIAWQGNLETEKQGGFAGRSFPLAAAAPLAQVPGVTLISLQKGAPSEQLHQAGFGVLELTDPYETGAEEVSDTAALMQALDLIITSDTLTAHLAGALALPVWLMLAASADWRWLRHRQDSPWYPTMKVYRQSGAGQWRALFERTAAMLLPLARR